MRFTLRYTTLVIALLMVVCVLGYRVISLHVFEQDFLRHQGEARTVRVVGISPYRGMITDRNGEPLAISTPVDSIWLNPKEFSKENPQLLTLAGLLDLSLEQLLEKAARNASREFVYLQRQVNPEVAEKIKALAIPGIHQKAEYRRYYPGGEITAHVLGFTNVDDRGQEGLERAFEPWLAGKAGSKRVVKDRRGREVEILEGIQEMRSGKDVVLSVDQRLQYLAYRELKAAVQERQAVAGSAVVIDVRTGEILAMVNQPSFNPNQRISLQEDGRCRNRAVTDVLEPGSVMKTFSVLAALQNGRITPTTMVDTSPGRLWVGGHIVQEDKGKDYGLLDVSGILQKSSNVGVTKLTLGLPSPSQCLWETYCNMGFGVPTDSGFPGESGGTLVKPSQNSSFVLATLAFGYGLNVTPLQLAQAYAILGAGGVKRPATFLKQNSIPAGEQVIEPTVARQIVEMLKMVVSHGGGTRAKVMGYQTAGKSGTARKVSATGGYQSDSHVAVFAGLAPASHPRFAIVVVIDEPKGAAYYGGQVAAPVFSKIAAGALRLFNIPPDVLDTQGLRVASAFAEASADKPEGLYE